MTIEAEIANAGDDAMWARVTQEVNAWRGACLQCFASVEVAVTETLLHLSAQPERGQAKLTVERTSRWRPSFV
jgi:hypothetical protein